MKPTPSWPAAQSGGLVAANWRWAVLERVGWLGADRSRGPGTAATHPIAGTCSLMPDQLADLSRANPEGYCIDPAAMPKAQRAILLGYREALLAYGGPSTGESRPGRAGSAASLC